MRSRRAADFPEAALFADRLGRFHRLSRPSPKMSTMKASLESSSARAPGMCRPPRRSDYIFGYTCVNDVTARDLQRKDGQWTRGKGFDTFCPVGPCDRPPRRG